MNTRRRRMQVPADLSTREREVLTLVAQGKRAKQICYMLSITKRTVDEHVLNSAKKLGASNRTHAVAIAMTAGQIDLDRPVPDVR